MRAIPTLLVGASTLLLTAHASAQWTPAPEPERAPTSMIPDSETPSPARSTQPRSPPNQPRSPAFVDDASPHAGEWYGWQTLIGLAASDAVAVIGVGVATGNNGGSAGTALIIVGATGHALVGPVVHFSHGHVGRGFAAFGLTLGAATATGLVGLGIGAAADHDCHSFCLGAPVGGLLGAMVGGVIGPFIDAGALSYEPDERKQSSLALMPLVSRHQTGLALGGTF